MRLGLIFITSFLLGCGGSPDIPMDADLKEKLDTIKNEEVPPNDGPVIHIYISADQEIYLEDELISLDSLPSKLEELTKGYTEEERAIATTSLKVDRDVKMGLISDIKQILRDLNAKRVEYKTGD